MVGINRFKLEIISLFSAGAFLLSIYNYLQNTINNPYLYVNLYKFIIISAILMILFIIYIVLEISSTLVNPSLNSELLSWASFFNKSSLIISCVLILYFLESTLLWKFKFINDFINFENYLMFSFAIIFFFLSLAFLFSYILPIIEHFARIYLNKKIYIIRTEYIERTYNILIIISLLLIFSGLALFIWSIPFASISYHLPLPGQVALDMKDINYINESTIRISIKVTGPETGISIKLFKEESNQLRILDFIDNVDSNHDLKTVSNNSLFVNSLGNGKYSVFINTSILSEGYYQFKCVIPQYEKIYGVSDFYLM